METETLKWYQQKDLRIMLGITGILLALAILVRTVMVFFPVQPALLPPIVQFDPAPWQDSVLALRTTLAQSARDKAQLKLVIAKMKTNEQTMVYAHAASFVGMAPAQVDSVVTFRYLRLAGSLRAAGAGVHQVAF